MSKLAMMKERFIKEPTFHSQLPFTFGNGFLVEDIMGECKQCGETICGDFARGNLNTAYTNTIVFDGHCLCQKCLTIFPVNGRIKEHKTNAKFEYIHKGRWVYKTFESSSLWCRIKANLKRFCFPFKIDAQ
jgi:hypothetical protein